jgi:two-component sensor histidine kinase
MNYKTAITLIFSLTVFGFSALRAQTNLVHYTPADGLVQTQCEVVFQDSKGYIWIGTKSGMSRFNGFEFENFDEVDELVGTRISEFFESSDNAVWSWSRKNLFKYKNGKITTYSVETDNAIISNTAYVGERVYYTLRSSDGLGFLGLWKISDGETRSVAVPDSFPVESVASMFLSEEDELYIFSGIAEYRSLYRLSENDKFEHIADWRYKGNYKFIPATGDSVLGFTELSFYSGRPHKLICSDKRDYIYVLNNRKFEKTGNRYYGHILWTDEEHNHIFAKNDSLFWNPVSESPKFLTLLPGIKAAMRDDQGNFWIASESGLFRLSVFENYDALSGIPPAIWSVAEYPKGRIWFFGLNFSLPVNQKVHLYDYSDNKVRKPSADFFKQFSKVELPYSSNPSFYIGSKVLSDSCLYITSNRGCFKYDSRTIEPVYFTNPYTEVFYIFEDTLSEKVFIGTSAGLHIYDFSDKELRFEKNLKRLIGSDLRIALCMERGSDGNIYIGTGNGLGRYDYTEENLYFAHKDTMPFSGIRSIYKDYKGNLWLGSENGLWHYDYKTLTKFKHPELSRQVSALCGIDKTSLLSGSLRGVAMIDVKAYYEGGEKRISFYDETAGYLGGEVTQNAIVKDSYGNVWIAGKEKVARFDYSKLKENQAEPKVYIDRVFYWEQNSEEKQLRAIRPILRSQENNFEFRFSGLSYGAPGQVYFKHKLEDYDEEVSAVSAQRFAVYKNLPPGEYTFKVWAANESGKWSEHPATVYFQIKPDLSQMLWFKIVAIVLSAAVIAWLTLFFYKSYKKNKQNRDKLAELQMLTITGQLYPHFLFNAVTNISNAIYQKKAEEAYTYTTKLIHLVRIVHESRKRTSLKIQEEILFIKTYLDIQKYRFGSRFDFDIIIEPNIDLQQQIPQMLIQNFVENAVKHGLEPLKEGGLLKVEIRKTKDKVLALVIDNGIGMEASKKNAHIGSGKGTGIIDRLIYYFNKQNRTSISYKIIDLYLHGEKGTRVEISIPRS